MIEEKNGVIYRGVSSRDPSGSILAIWATCRLDTGLLVLESAPAALSIARQIDADIKNRLRHPEKIGYDAYFQGFRVLACIFCDPDVSAFQKKKISGIRNLFAVAYLASRWRCRSK